MGKTEILNELIYDYTDRDKLFYQRNYSVLNTVWLYDDAKKGNSTVGLLEVWKDSGNSGRDYIIINNEIHYLDSIKEL